jgi:hypothetical protein
MDYEARLSVYRESVLWPDLGLRRFAWNNLSSKFEAHPEYPGTYDDFQLFDEGVWRIALGYPTESVPGFIEARERLIRKAMVYADKPHEASDAVAGSERLGRDGGMNERDVGCFLSAMFWPVRSISLHHSS